MMTVSSTLPILPIFYSKGAHYLLGSHPLLAQIPLTVSPFISLPTATTLPYTYKTLPSTLPQSSTGSTGTTADEKSKYIISPNGHSAHPDDIIASCKDFQAYLKDMKDKADIEIKAWEEAIQARELAEKRRVAPGWLDSDARLLEPEKAEDHRAGNAKASTTHANLMDSDASSAEASGLKEGLASAVIGEGEQLDKAFGKLGLWS